MTYPKKFRSKNDGLIVEFIALYKGTVIDKGNSSHKVGDYSDCWITHADTNIWEEVIEMTELEKVEQQLKELQETIARMKQEQAKPEVKQWEPKGGKWYVRSNGEVEHGQSTKGCRLFGTEYQTKEQAEWASKQMRKFNRLINYVVEYTEGIPKDIEIFAGYYGNKVHIYVPLVIDKRRELDNKIKSGEVVL